jgi:D-3-phosphoglycerate dehydrogenase
VTPPKDDLLRIVVAEHLPEAGWQALHAAPDVEVVGPFPEGAALHTALRDADALILRGATTVDEALLDVAPRLKAVARAGARLENVDMEACTRRGILVLHVPYANVFAVAEHTFGMLLAAVRHVPEGAAAIQRGEFPRHELMGTQLHGKTMGIIGFGRLGRAVAERALAFGLRVLVYDPYVDLSFAHERGVEVLGLDELLARCDILSLHTVLTHRTERMLDAAALARLKPGAVLVNCTHAGLLDEAALLEALDSGRVARAALDTVQQEPPAPDHPLLRHPRVLAVPHLNQNTVESQAATGREIVADLLAALRGEDFGRVANLPFDEQQPYRDAAPYLHLAAKLGKLQGQMAGGWIERVEVEVLGEGLSRYVRPIAASLLTGMLRPVDGRAVNWISAPTLAHDQGIVTAQRQDLVSLGDYPNLLACRIAWPGGSRTVAGVLFANGEARLVQFEGYRIDAHPEGEVIVIENEDVPGVIGRVGTMLGDHGINISNWRYGRAARGGRALSFINVDLRVPAGALRALASADEIHSARRVHL